MSPSTIATRVPVSLIDETPTRAKTPFHRFSTSPPPPAAVMLDVSSVASNESAAARATLSKVTNARKPIGSRGARGF